MLKLLTPKNFTSPVLSEEVIAAKQSFTADKSKIGFIQLPQAWAELKQQLASGAEIAKDKKQFVVIGIGGTDLGARAIVDALLTKYQRRIYFCGDTTDPKPLLDLTAELDLSSTLFLVTSKSGNTIEQAAAFVYWRDLVISSLGQEALLQHFIFLTDPVSGNLRKLSNEQGYKTLSIPPAVGGRYAVLSVVGMYAAYLAGLDVEKFLQGAADLSVALDSATAENDFALTYAAWQYHSAKKGQNIAVLLPYEYGLSEFARWFQQLWAESLGKLVDKNNLEVRTGTTPVNAVGPVFQHSQLQLYNEGPLDKTYTFVVANEPVKDVVLPADLSEMPDFAYLQSRKMHELLNQEYKTTEFSMRKHGANTVSLQIDKVDEYHLGQLFYFFEQVVVYLGYMYNIDPFNQPGVELSKNIMFGLLGKPDYASYLTDFEA